MWWRLALVEVMNIMATVGSVLCRTRLEPPVDDVDRLSLDDIRQEAALRLVQVFQREGKSFGQDVARAFDDEAGLAMQAYQWAYRDALRRKLGRATSADAMRPRPATVSLSRPSLGSGGSDGIGLTLAEVLEDPGQHDQLAGIDRDSVGELHRLWDTGIEGLSIAQTRRVLTLMWQTQDLKERGVKRVPDVLRQQIHRLRRETGLPLQTALL